jgi:hypothetical protein
MYSERNKWYSKEIDFENFSPALNTFQLTVIFLVTPLYLKLMVPAIVTWDVFLIFKL